MGHKLLPFREEQQKYAELIRNNPKEIIEEFGIKIKEERWKKLFKKNPFSLSVPPEKIRSLNSLESPNNVLNRDDLFYVA